MDDITDELPPWPLKPGYGSTNTVIKRFAGKIERAIDMAYDSKSRTVTIIAPGLYSIAGDTRYCEKGEVIPFTDRITRIE